MIGQVFDAPCMLELGVAFTHPALGELPAHAPEQSREDQHQNADDTGAPDVGYRGVTRGSQVLVDRKADEYGQGKSIEFARAGPPPHPIPTAGSDGGVSLHGVRGLYHGGVVYCAARKLGVSRTPDTHDAIGTDDAKHTPLAQLRSLVAADEVARRNRDDYRAVE